MGEQVLYFSRLVCYFLGIYRTFLIICRTVPASRIATFKFSIVSFTNDRQTENMGTLGT